MGARLFCAHPVVVLPHSVRFLVQVQARCGVFDDDQIDSYIELKMAEVMRFEMTPHPVEYDMDYSV